LGATFPFVCPVEGCDYSTYFRLGMGEELDPVAHAERVQILRAEHPNHPTQPTESSPARPSIAVGDPFVLDEDNVGNCPGEFVGPFGLVAMCVLDEGHGGVHVATDGQVVVQVWP